MNIKVLTATILLVLAFAATSFAQGSVFSLDGGSQVQAINPINSLVSMHFTNTGFLTTAAPPAAPNGNECANVYAFSTVPKMFLCCVCPVTVNQTIDVNFASNEETTVKILATPKGPGVCPSPASVVQASVIPFGFVASKDEPSGDTAAFSPYILGPVEVAQLTAQCASIDALGSELFVIPPTCSPPCETPGI